MLLIAKSQRQKELKLFLELFMLQCNVQNSSKIESHHSYDDIASAQHIPCCHDAKCHFTANHFNWVELFHWAHCWGKLSCQIVFCDNWQDEISCTVRVSFLIINKCQYSYVTIHKNSPWVGCIEVIYSLKCGYAKIWKHFCPPCF
jgi:hypothetical protein